MTKETKTTKQHVYYAMTPEGERMEIETPKQGKRISKYDNVVDYESYRPGNEEERMQIMTGGATGREGKYDTQGKEPSNLLVDIRQGKYDRAEVQKILENKGEELEKQQKEEIAKARQEYLDKKTGFTGMNENDKPTTTETK